MSVELKQYDSVEGAKLLLALAYSEGIVLNVTKIQKMLYIVYAYYLSKKDFNIFSETPKAWPYGPVFPRTRNKVDFSKLYKIDDLEEIKEDEDLKAIMKYVIKKYSNFSAGQLSDWSHMPNGPWDLTVKQPGFKWGDHIEDNYMKDYFEKYKI
ncbi:Panacea domain-containing protein [Empedobacter brevis]|uniref:Panacea domain-containing protein n=1 Tax=Empedobacter brevis TaxID=247 RepID=UPI002898E83B|nr:type II toxin-antitoxin system antitoxin SocA domain-containing protein [Empedobacter brevis]